MIFSKLKKSFCSSQIRGYIKYKGKVLEEEKQNKHVIGRNDMTGNIEITHLPHPYTLVVKCK